MNTKPTPETSAHTLALAAALDHLARSGMYLSGPCRTGENGTVLATVYAPDDAGKFAAVDAVVIGSLVPEAIPVRPTRPAKKG